MPSASDALQTANRFWTGLGVARRRGVIFAALVALLALGIWGAIALRGPSYAPLFTQLQPTDAAAIVSQLQAGKVPYRLSQGGATIDVPAQQVYQLRLQMAAKGLPNAGVVGFSLFNNTSLTQTNFDQQVNYLRALQGELTRTILYIQGVDAARVHLVLPQTGPFSTDSTPASAAVLLRLAPGAQLSPSQVRGIAHLVASSVQGLKPADVTILDSHGDMLSSVLASTGANPGNAAASQNLQTTAAFERTLQDKLQTLLGQVFGPTNVATRVQATLNFDQSKTTSQLFQPVSGGKQGVLKSIQQLQEQWSGTGTPPAPVGTASNTPSYPFVTGSTGKSTYNETQSTSNYAVSQVTQQTVVAPGSVSRLSVAVVVNGTLTTTQQASVQQLVSAAIGADPARKDQITVVGMPFATAAQGALTPKPKAAAAHSPLPLALAAVATLAVIAALVLTVRGGRGEAVAEEQERRLAAELLASRPSAPEREVDLDAEIAAEQQTRDIRTAITRRPADVARVVQGWLAEE